MYICIYIHILVIGYWLCSRIWVMQWALRIFGGPWIVVPSLWGTHSETWSL